MAPRGPAKGEAPAAAAAAPKPPAKPRRRRSRFGLLRVLVLLLGIGLVGGGVAAYALVRTVAGDLPDYRWLADYEPPQMSRIYAADSRLMAELATERRVFVPLEAIPPPRAGGLRQRRGPALLGAPGRRSDRHRPRRHDRRRAVRHGAAHVGRQHHHPAGRQEHAGRRRPHHDAQGARGDPGGAHRAGAAEGAHPRTLPERDLPGRPGLWRGGGGTGLFQQVARRADRWRRPPSSARCRRRRTTTTRSASPRPRKARRDWVLDRMAEDGAITAAEAAAAKAERLVPRPTRRPEMVAGRPALHRGGPARADQPLRRRSRPTRAGWSCAPASTRALQAATEQALRKGLTAYDRRRGGWRGPVAQINAARHRMAAASCEKVRAPAAARCPNGASPSCWRCAATRRGSAWSSGRSRAARRSRAPARWRFEDASWARRALDGRAGSARRRAAWPMCVAPGDVMMVETLPAAPRRAATRPAGAAGAAPDAGGGGRDRRARPEDRPRAGDGRRLVLRQEPVQPRHPGDAPARLLLQALRLHHGAGGRHPAEPALPRRRRSRCRRRRASGARPTTAAARPQRLRHHAHGAGEVAATWSPCGSRRRSAWTAVADAAARFGVIPNMPRYLAMSLGAGETTVLRMAAGYASFVNGGRRGGADLIDTVQDQRGRLIWRSDVRALPGLRRRRALAAGRRELAERAPAGHRPDRRLPDGEPADGRGAARHRHSRGRGAEPPRRRQDRHDGRLQGCLVRRLHPGHRGRGLDRLRRAAQPARTGRDRADVTGGRLAAPIFREVRGGGAARQPARALPRAARAWRWCASSSTTARPSSRPSAPARRTRRARRAAGGGDGSAGLDRGLGGLY